MGGVGDRGAADQLKEDGCYAIPNIWRFLWGLLCMTSAQKGGLWTPLNLRTKSIYFADREGGGGQQIPNFRGRHIWKPPLFMNAEAISAHLLTFWTLIREARSVTKFRPLRWYAVLTALRQYPLPDSWGVNLTSNLPDWRNPPSVRHCTWPRPCYCCKEWQLESTGFLGLLQVYMRRAI